MLCATTDAVVHAGAAVKLSASFAELRAVNCGGTLTAIALALSAQRGAPLIHISTNGIFPLASEDGAAATSSSSSSSGARDAPWAETCDTDPLVEALDSADGYGLSKWAAERAVVAAHREHGLPAVIVRLGNLGPSSVSDGTGNALDFQSMLIRGVCRTGVAPVHLGAVIEMTPVDYAAQAAVHVLGQPAHSAAGRIFHVVAHAPAAWEDVLSRIEAASTPVRRVSWSVFSDTVRAAAAAPRASIAELSLAALVDALPGGASYLARQPVLECAAFDAAVRAAGFRARADLRPIAVERFVRAHPRANARGAVDDETADRVARSARSGPLAGKVAVVTGASSGIGRGISIALAEAGCDVVLAARNIDRLEETCALLRERAPLARALVVHTDVTQLASVRRLVSRAEAEVGHIDILVNNAGVCVCVCVCVCVYACVRVRVAEERWRGCLIARRRIIVPCVRAAKQ